MKAPIWIVSFLAKTGDEVQALETAVLAFTIIEAAQAAEEAIRRDYKDPQAGVFITNIGLADEASMWLIGQYTDDPLGDIADWLEMQ